MPETRQHAHKNRRPETQPAPAARLAGRRSPLHVSRTAGRERPVKKWPGQVSDAPRELLCGKRISVATETKIRGQPGFCVGMEKSGSNPNANLRIQFQLAWDAQTPEPPQARLTQNGTGRRSRQGVPLCVYRQCLRPPRLAKR